MPLLKLQPRHHAFLAAFRANGYANASQAYVLAKFHGKHPDARASGLMRQPLIQAELKRLQELDRQTSSVSLEDIRAGIKEDLARAIDRNDLNASLRARELLGKTIGAFTDRVETVNPNMGNDAEVAAKLAVLIVAALAHAGALKIEPKAAESAVIHALTGPHQRQAA